MSKCRIKWEMRNRKSKMTSTIDNAECRIDNSHPRPPSPGPFPQPGEGEEIDVAM